MYTFIYNFFYQHFQFFYVKTVKRFELARKLCYVNLFMYIYVPSRSAEITPVCVCFSNPLEINNDQITSTNCMPSVANQTMYANLFVSRIIRTRSVLMQHDVMFATIVNLSEQVAGN